MLCQAFPSPNLEKKLNRQATEKELTDYLGISIDEFNYWKKAFEANVVQSLDTAYNEYSILFASTDENPELSLQNKELKEQIRDALNVLNPKEALVAQLYYVEELNIYEIAEVLEISTGRISQIKKSIIGKLRDEISPD